MGKMTFKKWLLLAAGIYIFSLIVGLLLPIDMLFEGIASESEELAQLFADMSPGAVFSFLLFRNSSVLLLTFIFAPGFLMAPLLALVVNGGYLGLVASVVIQEESLGFLLAGVLPHGILEIPAFLIAQAAAMSFGLAALLALFKKEARSQLLPSLRKNFRYLTIALLLLLPAAAIETFITPLLID
jgi:stage II sporulation protein M